MTMLAEGGIILSLPSMGQGTDFFLPFKNIEDYSLRFTMAGFAIEITKFLIFLDSPVL